MNVAARQPVAAPALADLPAAAFRQQLMIRFSHCDPGGIVYFANYFDIANGVVEDFFPRALGVDYHELVGPRRVGLGFAHVACDFLKPGRLGDSITFAVLIDRVGSASIGMTLYGYRETEPMMAMRLVMVTTSLTTYRAIPIPDDLRSAVERYKETCQ